MTVVIHKINNSLIESNTERNTPINEIDLKTIHRIEKIFINILTTHLHILNLKKLAEEFEPILWQKKLLLAINMLLNQLAALPDTTLLINFYIIEDQTGSPLEFLIEYAGEKWPFSLSEIAHEVNRIKKFNLTYLYDREKTSAEINETVIKLQSTTSVQDRLALLAEFNKKWQGQLVLENTIEHLSYMPPNVYNDKYTITDASGVVFGKSRRYPAIVNQDAPEPQSNNSYKEASGKKNSLAFFNSKRLCKTAAYVISAGAIVATGMYLAM